MIAFAECDKFRQPARAPNGWGLVTIGQMVAALVHAVEEPARGLRVMEVPQIQQYPRADYQRAAAR